MSAAIFVDVVQVQELEYQVTVYTSDIRNAGTSASVFCELHGAKGSLGASRLENSSTNFSRGQKDAFVIRGSDIGEISKAVIWHDNAGLSAAWHLQQVEVVQPLLQKTYIFPCGQWLQKQPPSAATQLSAATAKAAGAVPGCLVILCPGGGAAAAGGASGASNGPAQKVTYKVEVQVGGLWCRLHAF